MEELAVLRADKEYDHQESKNLLKDVREFFQSKLRIIVPEWIKKKETVAKDAPVGVVEAFYIREGSRSYLQKNVMDMMIWQAFLICLMKD